MFALAPTLVAGPNEALTSTTKADTALPSALFGETLRVAVYAETNTTLPSYASGGVSTAHYANLISFLDVNDYAVTAISTQDILDHKLMAASFDVFIIPNNLPKDDIVDPVIDYWLAGGGILSFDIGVGFLYYQGMIVSAESGSFGLLNVDAEEHWGYKVVDNFTIGERHSTAIDYEVDDVIQIGENTTIHDRDHFANANPADFVHLLIDSGDNDNTCGFALDHTERQGGRIVQLPGNCSTIPVWERSIITDAIDWLAPKTKARVAFDFTHKPYYGVDSWDENVSHAPRFNIWRDFLVNHSYTVDKLYPTGSNLTSADLAPFDVIVVALPFLNYSLIEISLIRTWVSEGNSLLYLGDWQSVNIEGQTTFNELMDPWGLAMDLDGANAATFTTTDFNEHQILEGVSTVQISGGDFLNITGDAYPVVNQSTDVMVGASEPGLGRVVVIGDVNIFDYTHLQLEDNLQFALSIINWLSAANADVLLYVRNHDLDTPYNAPAAQALNDLGLPYQITYISEYMNLSLYSQQWNLVILDSCWPGIGPFLDDISAYLDTGGELIVSWHMMTSYPSDPLYSRIGFEYAANYPDEVPFYVWEPSHGVFNYPNNYGALNFTPGYDIGEEGDLMTVFSNATALAGITDTNQPGNATIVYGLDGQVLWNGHLLDELTDDLDDSTYMDAFELWENEIAFMYYERPIINHPDDVTYAVTETGNEISWTPAAPADPWEYIVRENGSIIESGHWSGGAITINVDGANVSITEYELTVFDILGYSASDMVILNVTAASTTTTTTTGGGLPIDTTTLLLIVAAVLVVIIIIVIAKKRK